MNALESYQAALKVANQLERHLRRARDAQRKYRRYDIVQQAKGRELAYQKALDIVKEQFNL